MRQDNEAPNTDRHKKAQILFMNYTQNVKDVQNIELKINKNN